MAQLVQYSHLYRVLNDDENDLSNGISAKDPNAVRTVEEHVANGSYFPSQYISTSATSAAAEDFARKGQEKFPGPRTIAIINTRNIPADTVEYTDLTIPFVLDLFIPQVNQKAQNFARKFKEVIIKGSIPKSCIEDVYIV